MPQDERRVYEVWEELKEVRRKGVNRLDDLSTGKAGPVLTPWLEAAAKAVPGHRPTLTRPQVVKLLLNYEIPRMDSDHPYREWLPTSLGLTDKTRSWSPNQCREEAARIAGYSKTHFERSVGGPERNGLHVLAAQIVADCFQYTTSSPPDGDAEKRVALGTDATVREIADTLRNLPVVRSKPGALVRQTWQERMLHWSNPYVPRRKYQEEIRRFLTSRRRVFLVGLPGMGKTRLACEVATELAEEIGAEAIRLRGDTQNRLLLDMENELIRRGVRVTDEHRIAREFTAMAEVAEPPLVIVIDNLEDADVIDRVLPRNFHATVVVTARSRLLDEDGWPTLELDEMSPEEAVSLARAQLPPDVQAADAARLAEALADYPLAIIHASSLLARDQSMSIESFCRALKLDASQVLKQPRPGERKERALTFIYSSLLANLEQTHPQAADLLKTMALLKQAQAPRGLLHRIFEGLPHHRPDAVPDDYNQVEFIIAVQVLENYVLVSASPDELDIHQLVQALLRSLIRGKDQSTADATVDGLNRWLRQAPNQDRTAVGPWLETIFPLVDTAQGRDLRSDGVVSLGELLGVALAAAVATNDHETLDEARRSWFYRWATTESGSDNDALAYVQYDWLSLSDSEYEPLAIARLGKRRQASHPLDFSRKAALAGVRDWTATRDQTLRLPLPNGSVRLVQPMDEFHTIVRHMLNGNLHEARNRAQSLIKGTTPMRTVIDMHLLLSTIALRQRDLSLGRRHMSVAQGLLSDSDTEKSPLQLARFSQLEGDMAHRECLDGYGDWAVPKQRYQQARDRYWYEPIPLGRLEAERKLACVTAYANKQQHAEARLRTLLLQAEAPLYRPLQHRIELSLAKLALLRGQVTMDNYESSWSAAEFYATSPASDRYWYVESIMTAYIAGSRCDAPEEELLLLFEAITREALLIGRQDKAQLVSSLRTGTVDLTQLLAD